MRNIDKIIHWKIIEISIMIAIITISFPLWKRLELKEIMTTAALYDNAKYTYLKIDDHATGPMFPLSDKEAFNLTPSKIELINETNTSENVTILMKISKSSSLDFNCLNIAIDSQKKQLNDLYVMDDSDYFYFNIKSDVTKAETKKYNFLLWMDASTGNEMMGKNLTYSFELQKGALI